MKSTILRSVAPAVLSQAARLSLSLAAACALPGICAPPAPAAEVEYRIVLAGDSTVAEQKDPIAYRGWGMYLPSCFANTVRVVNLAKNGRSTKTFLSEGWWSRVLAEKPDVVLIQFGHNDSHSKDKPEATDAATDYTDNLRRYVDEARAAGAVPILITPVARRLWKNGRADNSSLRPYANAMKEVAAETKAGLIDLNASSLALYEQLGPEATALLGSPNDNTHFSEKGARTIVGLVMKELPGLVPGLENKLARPDQVESKR